MAEFSKRKAISLIAISVLLTSAAQLLFRFAMQGSDIGQNGAGHLLTRLAAVDPVAVLAGISFYGASMLIWMFALTRLAVSLAYPMLSLSYIIVYVGATMLPVFGESVSITKMLGIGIIVVGVSILSLEASEGRGA